MIRLPIEGEHFGRYRLQHRLGQGGMGVVYRAHDTTLDREVALKLVVPHLAGDDGFRARFQHEASVLARLDSPRIVRIFDHGEHDGMLYLVTQLIQGGDLLRLIHREGSLPPALATNVMAQVVEGLCDAHAVGVVHRDIKPANVLLRERGRELEAFLCDFGIATTPGADLSRTGTIAGSLPYMAPERHQGEDAGEQGDVYAAGCLFWHALTGTAPYAGTDVEVAMAHLQAAIPQLPGKDRYSAAVNAILRRAMAKDRTKRYPTARALHRDLAAAAALAPDAITLPGATAIRQQVVLGTRRRRWLPAALAVAASVVVLATAVVAGGSIGGGDRRETADAAGGPPATTAAAVDGAPVIERPVLVPRSSDRTPPTWQPDAVQPRSGGDGPGDAPALETPRDPAPGPSRAPKRDRGTRAPQPGATETRTTTAPPAYRYRCWDGRRAYRYGDCTAPTGRTGAGWVFGSFGRLGCTSYDVAGGADRESWVCDYGQGNRIVFTRWRDPRAAKAHYRAWFNRTQRTERAWYRGGERYGVHLYGRSGSKPGNRRWRDVHVYEKQPWTVAVNARSMDARDRGVAKVNDYRRPSRLKGAPIS
jgi:hypothetical protein